MPDPYATIADADASLQQQLSDILELRASDPQQRSMLRAYLSEIELPRGARALEVGCGTGAVSRALVELLNLEVTGVDPSPIFVARAQELGKHLPGLTFMLGDARSLTLPDASFDLVVSLNTDAADDLRKEGRRRAQAGEFFGHISFVSAIARKPA